MPQTLYIKLEVFSIIIFVLESFYTETRRYGYSLLTPRLNSLTETAEPILIMMLHFLFV